MAINCAPRGAGEQTTPRRIRGTRPLGRPVAQDGHHRRHVASCHNHNPAYRARVRQAKISHQPVILRAAGRRKRTGRLGKAALLLLLPPPPRRRRRRRRRRPVWDAS